MLLQQLHFSVLEEGIHSYSFLFFYFYNIYYKNTRKKNNRFHFKLTAENWSALAKETFSLL